MQTYDLNIVNKFATRFAPNSKPSLLDLICVNNVGKINHIDQFPMDGISDHEMLFLSYDLKFNRKEPDFELTYRCYNGINMEELSKEASGLDWNGCLFFSKVDEKVQYLNNLVTHLFNKLVPLKTITIRGHRKPWFTEEILRLIKSVRELIGSGSDFRT